MTGRCLALGLALLVASGCGGCAPDRTRALGNLKAEEPAVRAEAVRLLGRAAREEDYLLFAKAAGDPAAAVRIAALETLGARRDSRAVELAASLLGDPEPAVQEAAAECLGRLPSPKARPYLLESYGRRGPVARAAIARVLAGAGLGPGEAIRAEARYLRERNEAALTRGTLAERVGAAEELGRSGTPEAVAVLRRLLADTSVPLAAAAARGLGAAGDRASTEELVPLLASEHPELRDAAAVALGALGGAAAAEALARAAREPNPGAVAAALALSRIPESGPLACKTALAARAPEPARALARHAVARNAPCEAAGLVKRFQKGGLEALAALAAGGPLKAAELVEPAGRILDDPGASPDLRKAAIAFLGDAGGPALADRLVAHLEQLVAVPAGEGESPAAAGTSPRATPGSGEAGPPPGTPEDGSAGQPEAGGRTPGDAAAASPELFATVRALGATGHAPAVQPLLPLLAHPVSQVREAAVEALGALGTPEALAAVARSAREDDAALVRLAAVGALGKAGPRAREALLAVALGEDPATRGAALQALARSGSPLSPEAVQDLSGSGLPEAAVALGALGHREARPLLLASLGTPTLVGRAELLEALGRLGDPGVASAVARELHHDRPEIRVAACQALAHLNPEAARETLAALAAEDYYVAVRRAAATALAVADGT